MKSDIPVDAFFSFLFFCCFLPSKNLLIICFPSFCPTEFLSCCFDSLRFFPDKFFFQFVIVPSSLTQLPMLLLAYRTTRFMSRCVLPIIFSILCPWQGKGLPLSDGKREGRACQRCDLNWCSHLEGVRATARNTRCHQLQTCALCCSKAGFLLLLSFAELTFFLVCFPASTYLAVFSVLVFSHL